MPLPLLSDGYATPVLIGFPGWVKDPGQTAGQYFWLRKLPPGSKLAVSYILASDSGLHPLGLG